MQYSKTFFLFVTINFVVTNVLFSAHIQARESRWGFGMSSSTRLRLKPVQEQGDSFININGEAKIKDYLGFNVIGEFAFNGLKEKTIVTQMRGYLFPSRTLSPLAAVAAVLQYDPRSDIGLRFSLGVDYDLSESLGWDYLSLFFSTSLQTMFKNPETTEWEYLRLGVVLRY